MVSLYGALHNLTDFLYWFLSTQGLELDKEFTLPKTTMIGGGEKALPLREIISRLRAIYCGSVGVEFMFINDRQKCESTCGIFFKEDYTSNS